MRMANNGNYNWSVGVQVEATIWGNSCRYPLRSMIHTPYSQLTNATVGNVHMCILRAKTYTRMFTEALFIARARNNLHVRPTEKGCVKTRAIYNSRDEFHKCHVEQKEQDATQSKGPGTESS